MTNSALTVNCQFINAHYVKITKRCCTSGSVKGAVFKVEPQQRCSAESSQIKQRCAYWRGNLI